jgi:hypothetical protein
VGPRTGLDDVERRKNLPLRGLELRLLNRSTCSQSLYLNYMTLRQPNLFPSSGAITNFPGYNISTRIAQKTPSLLLFNRFRGSMFVCEAFTQQRLSYICLFRGRCLPAAVVYRVIT